MAFLYNLLAFVAPLLPLLQKEAEHAEAAGGGMGSSIWIVLMILVVALIGGIWYITTRIQPPNRHDVAHEDSH